MARKRRKRSPQVNRQIQRKAQAKRQSKASAEFLKNLNAPDSGGMGAPNSKLGGLTPDEANRLWDGAVEEMDDADLRKRAELLGDDEAQYELDQRSGKAGQGTGQSEPTFTKGESDVDGLAEDYLMADNYAGAEKAKAQLEKIANSNSPEANRASQRLADVEYDRTEPVIDSLRDKSMREMGDKLESSSGLEREEVERALKELSNGSTGPYDAANATDALDVISRPKVDTGRKGINPDGTSSGENLYDPDDAKNKLATAKVDRRNAAEQAARTRAENQGNATDKSAKGLPPGIKKTNAGIYFAQDLASQESLTPEEYDKRIAEGKIESPTSPRGPNTTHRMVSANFGAPGSGDTRWNVIPLSDVPKYEAQEQLASDLIDKKITLEEANQKGAGTKARGQAARKYTQQPKGTRSSPRKGLPTHGPKRKGARNSAKGGNWRKQPRDPNTGRWI